MQKMQTTKSNKQAKNASSQQKKAEALLKLQPCTNFSCLCKWEIPNFKGMKKKQLQSQRFALGNYEFYLMMNMPKGAFGYTSFYVVIDNPGGLHIDCYASIRVKIVNVLDSEKAFRKECFVRFSKDFSCSGWAKFAVYEIIVDHNSGFLNGGYLCIDADIRVLDDLMVSSMGDVGGRNSVVLSGKATWTIKNFGLFEDVIDRQKMLSPCFPVGEAVLRFNLCKVVINGVEYLSVLLEIDKTFKTLWCLFRISVLSRKPGVNHLHRDHYGRFDVDDVNIIGWTEYVKMSDFRGNGFLVDDSVDFSISFNAIAEMMGVKPIPNSFSGNNCASVVKRRGDISGCFGWKIENFGKLKDVMKKKKLSGVCIRSKRVNVQGLFFCLIVYPRGKSRESLHLSLFLEVLDPQNADWSSNVFYQLSVIKPNAHDQSIVRESLDWFFTSGHAEILHEISESQIGKPYPSSVSKECGWSEFMSLTTLFDKDSGYLVQDTAFFTARFQVLKEIFIMDDITESTEKASCCDTNEKKCSVTWKVENFLSLEMKMTTPKVVSKFFKVGGCELRIGVYKSFDDHICAYVESDQSVHTEADKNFWVSYRMTLVNQKDAAKNLSRESCLITKNPANSDLQLMKTVDILKADAGFVIHDMITFVCEILDCCPLLDVSEPELLALGDCCDDSSSGNYELYDSEISKAITGNIADIINVLVVGVQRYLMDENSSEQLLSSMKKLVVDSGMMARLLIGIRLCLNDSVKVKCLLSKTKSSSCNVGKQAESGVHEPSANLENHMTEIEVLPQMINDMLLDIMIECCQPVNFSAEDSYHGNSKPSAPIVTDVYQPGSHWDIRPAVTNRSSVHEGSRAMANVSTDLCAVECLILNGIGMLPEKEIFELCDFLPEISAIGPLDYKCNQAFKTKWPEASEELLRLIINSLKALVGPVSQFHLERRQKPRSEEKVFVLLKNAPTHLQPDLVILLPQLINRYEHPDAACAFLDELTKPCVEPALQLLVLTAITRMDLEDKGWEQIFYRALQLLEVSNPEMLVSAINFLFKAAFQCQQIPEAVKVVRANLVRFGAGIAPSLLDLLSRTINSQHEIAEIMLTEAYSVFALDGKGSENPSGTCLSGEGVASKSLDLADEPLVCANNHFSDIFMLIDMLAIPSIAVAAGQVFEKGVAYGFIKDHVVDMVLKRYVREKISVESITSTQNYEHIGTPAERKVDSLCLESFFTLVLGLAEALSLSSNTQVHSFVKMFYATVFRLFTGEIYHRRMLRQLIEHASSAANSCSDIYMEILVFLVQGDCGYARLVLSMMKEMQAELSNMTREKTNLLERLTESESATIQHKSEMEVQKDQFASEKKKLCSSMEAIKSQLEQCLSEKESQIAKLSMENKSYQDWLHDMETQCSKLKSQNLHELKKVVKEKEVLAERLRNEEAGRKMFDNKLKTYASDVAAQEKAQQVLQDKISQLKQKVDRIEGEKQKKEEENAWCRAYIDDMNEKLDYCQRCIQKLENELYREMSQHAPLYGKGLEELSRGELETVACIHEEGLRKIRAIQQRVSTSTSDVGQSNSTRHNNQSSSIIAPHIFYQRH